MLVQRINLEKGWLGRGVEGLPDCNDQNVELNGEGVEPDRHIEYRVNLLLIVTFLSGLNLERLLQFWVIKGCIQVLTTHLILFAKLVSLSAHAVQT